MFEGEISERVLHDVIRRRCVHQAGESAGNRRALGRYGRISVVLNLGSQPELFRMASMESPLDLFGP